jgi:hypothetical protein
VAVTFVLALPLYWYIVGRCSDGRGAAGLVERSIPGWRGKLIVLVLLGFAAVDFVITRSLSLADASIHFIHNPYGRRLAEQLPIASFSQGLASWPPLASCLKRLEEPQVLVTLILSILSVGLWQLLKHGVSRVALYVSTAAVLAYLTLTGVVLVSGVSWLSSHPDIAERWWATTTASMNDAASSADGFGWIWTMAGVALWSFPQLALGLSGFGIRNDHDPFAAGGRRRTRRHATSRAQHAEADADGVDDHGGVSRRGRRDHDAACASRGTYQGRRR